MFRPNNIYKILKETNQFHKYFVRELFFAGISSLGCLYTYIVPYYFSLGCGIGYGYLHRIPDHMDLKKPSATASIPTPPQKTTGDGFSEV